MPLFRDFVAEHDRVMDSLDGALRAIHAGATAAWQDAHPGETMIPDWCRSVQTPAGRSGAVSEAPW